MVCLDDVTTAVLVMVAHAAGGRGGTSIGVSLLASAEDFSALDQLSHGVFTPTAPAVLAQGDGHASGQQERGPDPEVRGGDPPGLGAGADGRGHLPPRPDAEGGAPGPVAGAAAEPDPGPPVRSRRGRHQGASLARGPRLPRLYLRVSRAPRLLPLADGNLRLLAQ